MVYDHEFSNTLRQLVREILTASLPFGIYLWQSTTSSGTGIFFEESRGHNGGAQEPEGCGVGTCHGRFVVISPRSVIEPA